jgi:tetratricopeptide (TPR) repeat protein
MSKDLLKQGLDFLKKKEYDKAREIIDEVLKTDSFYGYAYYAKALLEVAEKHDTIAIDYLCKSISINPDMNGSAYFERGKLKEKFKDYKGAIDDYTKAIETKSNYAEAYYNRANLNHKINRDEQSIKDYTSAISYGTKNKASAYNNRGASNIKLKNYRDAISDFTNAIKNNTQSKYHKNRGIAETYINEQEEAINDFNKALEIDSSDADTYNLRGIAKVKIEHYDDAMQDYNSAISINSKHYQAYCNRGSLNILLQNYNYALLDCSESIKINNKYAEAYYYQAIAKFYLNDKDGSAKNFTEAFNNGKDVLSSYAQEKTFSEELCLLLLGCKCDKNYFYRVTKNIKNKNQMRNIYKKIYLQSIKIMRSLLIKDVGRKFGDERDYGIAHYTSKPTGYILSLDERSKFRLYSISTTNDSEEGNVLFKYLNIEQKSSNQEYQAFTSCFTFDAECLNQFRLYGKTAEKEATGVSLVFSKEFFKNSAELQMPEISFDESSEPNEKYSQSKLSETDIYPIHRCVYIDPDTKKVISVGHREDYTFYRDTIRNKGNDVNAIDESIISDYHLYINEVKETVKQEFEKMLKIMDNLKNTGDSDILSKLLVNIRYLVKHVAFKEEQECRIIKTEKLAHNTKIKNDNYKIYIETRNVNKLIRQIYFAPLAEGIKPFQDRLQCEGLDIQCLKCTHPYNNI